MRSYSAFLPPTRRSGQPHPPRRHQIDNNVQRFVERTFGWINRARRLAKDFEATTKSSLAWLLVALAFLLVRRLATRVLHNG
ncbi:transposase (plasmid) [Methylocystis parvus OBBP]|uniref:Transposase n=1 Tax=Methylocystis parvus TaxID=134 RepID=A0A6B8MEB1_9HYPH|nr:transposase [Methylocystis parvus]QGM99899.1 transposase [Methylocystis parvus]WBK02322.1 transposase [Methylocystis parvus OBBP]